LRTRQTRPSRVRITCQNEGGEGGGVVKAGGARARTRGVRRQVGGAMRVVGGGGGGSLDTGAATLRSFATAGALRGGPAAALPRGIEPRPLTTIWPPGGPSQQVHDTARSAWRWRLRFSSVGRRRNAASACSSGVSRSPAARWRGSSSSPSGCSRSLSAASKSAFERSQRPSAPRKGWGGVGGAHLFFGAPPPL